MLCHTCMTLFKTKNKIFVFFCPYIERVFGMTRGWVNDDKRLIKWHKTDKKKVKYWLKHCNEMLKYWYLATPPFNWPFWSGLTVHIIFIECPFASFGDRHHWSCGVSIYFTLSAGNWRGKKAPSNPSVTQKHSHTHWPVLYKSMASFWPTDKSWAGLESDWMPWVNSSLSTHTHTYKNKQKNGNSD